MHLIDANKKVATFNDKINREYLLPIGIFVSSFFLRILNVARPTNTDEALWVSRGIKFMNALFSGNLADTYTKHHPGITNMWVIGTAQLISSWLHNIFPSLLGLDREPLLYTCLEPPTDCAPLSLFVVSRILQAVITSGCMVLIYVLIKRLFSKAIAILTISFLLFEPFFLAYQRFITTDALQVDFSFISVLFLLLYLRENKIKKLLLSGIFFGLAIASKVPALFVLPAIIIWLLLIELGWGKDSFPQRGWTKQTLSLIILGAIAGLTIFLIFPALWTSPIETLQTWYAGLQREEDRGNLFFMGENTDSPGVLFYPVVLLFRLSPLFQIGILAFLLALIVPKLRKKLTQIPELFAIFLVPIVILSLLSLSDSKIDRYILLAIPGLAIISAIGWLQIYHSFKTLLIKKSLYLTIAFIVLQAVFSFSYQPHYLTYFNPLLGGVKTAKNLILVGQGEGLDLAAKYLNKLPNANKLKVSAWYPAPLDLYFSGKTLDMYWGENNDPKINLLTANYAVLYLNQFQRQLPDRKMLDYFSQQKPVFQWNVDRVNYVLAYPGLTPTTEDLKNIENPLDLTWGDRVILRGYDLDRSDSDEIKIIFYWQFLEDLPSDTQLNIKLTNNENEIFNTSSSGLVNDYVPFEKVSSGNLIRDVRKFDLTTTMKSDVYDLKITWNFPEDTTNTSYYQAISKIKL